VICILIRLEVKLAIENGRIAAESHALNTGELALTGTLAERVKQLSRVTDD
jgi:hypothetical protein